MHYAIRLWVCTPRHLARQVGEALASLVHLLLISMVRVVDHSHHHDDVEMTEGVVSSAPRVFRLPAPGATVPVEQPPLAAAHVARQRESGRPSKAPSHAASSGALAAARELLCNPPAAAASPDALRQWREDVDRLLYLAQASPSSARTGQRPPPGNAVIPYHQRQGGASASVRSPTVRGCNIPKI